MHIFWKHLWCGWWGLELDNRIDLDGLTAEVSGPIRTRVLPVKSPWSSSRVMEVDLFRNGFTYNLWQKHKVFSRLLEKCDGVCGPQPRLSGLQCSSTEERPLSMAKHASVSLGKANPVHVCSSRPSCQGDRGLSQWVSESVIGLCDSLGRGPSTLRMSGVSRKQDVGECDPANRLSGMNDDCGVWADQDGGWVLRWKRSSRLFSPHADATWSTSGTTAPRSRTRRRWTSPPSWSASLWSCAAACWCSSTSSMTTWVRRRTRTAPIPTHGHASQCKFCISLFRPSFYEQKIFRFLFWLFFLNSKFLLSFFFT